MHNMNNHMIVMISSMIINMNMISISRICNIIGSRDGSVGAESVRVGGL